MSNLNSFFMAAKASPLTDTTGKITMPWHNFFQQLTQYISQNVNPEGLQTPPQNTANIAVLNNMQSLGKIVYNSDNDTALINLAGTFKTIQTM